MCSPTLIITAFSAVMTMSSANQQARAVRANAANAAAVNEWNAKQQDAAALDSEQRGADAASQIRERAKRANATGRAAMGSTGFLADSGNNLDLLGDNAQTGALDALTEQGNYNREAYSYRTQGQNLRFQGKLGTDQAASEAAQIRRNGLLDATGTLVSGASSMGRIANPFERTTNLSNGQSIRWNTDRRGVSY